MTSEQLKQQDADSTCFRLCALGQPSSCGDVRMKRWIACLNGEFNCEEGAWELSVVKEGGFGSDSFGWAGKTKIVIREKIGDGLEERLSQESIDALWAIAGAVAKALNDCPHDLEDVDIFD